MPLEVVAALLMGLLCEAKALLKWTFSLFCESAFVKEVLFCSLRICLPMQGLLLV